jgi:recombinational DNA repair ATPase RecF
VIQIQEIWIREFRGIRDLRLHVHGDSFVVWGPNGSGKSGVVDAIEFALTGAVSRLAGTGSGGLTVTRHGPHVHRRDDPAAAVVALTIRDSASGKEAVLQRSVKNAKDFTLSPELPEVRTAVELARAHPELTLSRRDITKFIVVEAGKRAQEVQALLKLDRLAAIRQTLRTVQTKATTAANNAEAQLTTAQDSLRRHLDIPSLGASDVLAVVNSRRRLLGLAELASTKTPLDEGVARRSASPFDRSSAIRDITALQGEISDDADARALAMRLAAAGGDLTSDPQATIHLAERELVSAGIRLTTEARCPLCDSPWPSKEHLQQHLSDKLDRTAATAAIETAVRDSAATLAESLQRVATLAATVRDTCRARGISQPANLLDTWQSTLRERCTRLRTITGALELSETLAADPLGAPRELAASLGEARTRLEGMNDEAESAKAASFLVLAQERLNVLRMARSGMRKMRAGQAAAHALYKTYCSVQDSVLTDLYHSVEDEFAAFYRQVNADDEGTFKAHLDPEGGKLDLAVDFYGQGMFPPVAYHSEGHQDGMGVCLYLALVRKVLGAEFRFAVLDDVVMSIDSQHRHQFCQLLRQHFPQVQFIITTHDQIWAQQMQSAGLIKKGSQARFHSWSLDHGPVCDEGQDFWDAIAASLESNDVPAAAARLRRGLESVLSELAANLRAHVPFRTDGRYKLGELLGGVNGAHSKWLGAAAKSAQSWGNTAAAAAVKVAKDARSAAILSQSAETWAVNPAVHFTEWADFSKQDFEPVVEAWKAFLAQLRCPKCEALLYVVGAPGQEDCMRCACDALHWNLRTKA